MRVKIIIEGELPDYWDERLQPASTYIRSEGQEDALLEQIIVDSLVVERA